MIARWLIKSLIIKHACDSGSGWALKTEYYTCNFHTEEISTNLYHDNTT